MGGYGGLGGGNGWERVVRVVMGGFGWLWGLNGWLRLDKEFTK